MPEGDGVDKTMLSTLCGDHYRASGGKDKGLTFAIIERVAGTRQLNDVPTEKYDDLARALLKDAARYKYGVKKAL